VNLSEITKLIDVPSTAVALLERPEKETTLAINISVNEKKLVQTTAYVCLYNTVRGPAKGGIRFHPHVNLLETRKLAELMVWKTALVGIPFGGGKTGVTIDPHEFTRVEKTIIMKELVHLIRNELINGDYIPAPDMGTDAHDMATIFGEIHLQECVTGKPPRVGGLPGREGRPRGAVCR
jgi:glutamate dehydrogenase (NAD(P)+)